jgi:thioredoxin 1
MSKSVQTADDSTFERKVLEADELVLVDFWAPWCGPCRMQSPLLEKFAEGREDVSVVKVNVDESPRTAASYGIRSIPTLAVFSSGKPVLGALGLQNAKGLDQLVSEAKAKLPA